ncbi:MAG: hypothetical protein QOD83_2131 [Solirubrobacteraceae bacterium]|nr:hypothetical protein [Solirubrobacteraceae bacterium]
MIRRHWPAVLALLVGCLVLTPAVAQAGLVAGAGPSFPTVVTVGQTGVPATIEMRNDNTAGNSGSTNIVCNAGDAPPCPSGDPGITLIPSCGQLGTFSVCAPAGADPGVFALPATAQGQVGTACALMNFNVTLIDPVLGQLRFTPQPPGTNVQLMGAGQICRIGFTFNVLKTPNVDQDPATAGLQTVQIVDNTQRSGAITASGRGTSDGTTILRATTSIATNASPDITLGAGVLSDAATVSGRVNPQPGATIHFELFGPADATCTGTPVLTSTVPYPVAGGAVTSAPFTPTVTGTYHWVAAYSGDANNASAQGACNDANETTVVTRAAPSMTTNASANTTLGAGLLSDAATVSGRVNPQSGATIQFELFGPADATCTGAPIFTSTVAYPVAGGSVTSAPFTPTQAGTYHWIAAYSGDVNNAPVQGACNDANETTVVTRAAPTITTNASANTTLGAGLLSDAATVSGRVNPQSGATIQFELFGPADATCTGAPIFTSTVAYPVAGGSVTSAPFTPTVTGTYHWIAIYSGDVNNAPVQGACNDASETTVVTRAAPSITTNASANTTLGAGVLSDAATVSGRFAPQSGATILFELFGPADATCTGAPMFTSTVAYPVAGGSVTSAPFTPTVTGTYHWIATYSGDINNAPTQGACNDASETTVVTLTTPTITTNASANTTLGAGVLSDAATVSGRLSPQSGATILFELFGPADATCTGTPMFTSTVAYPVAGGSVTSAPFTPPGAGTYHWVATYSGDVNNATVKGACNDANETTVVSRAAPSITTNASPDIMQGAGTLLDHATVTGRVNPVAGATIAFALFGPADATCAGTPMFTSTVSYPVAGGSVPSASFTPTEAGVYHWVAAYSGDSNNAPVTGACNDANETVTVTPAPATTPPTTTPPTTTPPPVPVPVAAVAPKQSRSPAKGVASISSGGHTGCAGTPFRVNVTGTGVRRVVFSLDGRVISTVTSKNYKGRFSVMVKPAKLKRGVHRVLARITYLSSTATNPKTMRVVFSRCSRTSPQFTG